MKTLVAGILCLIGGAALATVAAPSPKPAPPALTISQRLATMPADIWPNPKGNPIREDANRASRARWFAKNATDVPIKINGYVANVDREGATIICGVYSISGSSVTSGGNSVHFPKTDERIFSHGECMGLFVVHCAPPLNQAEKVPVEPLLELKTNEHVAVMGLGSLNEDAISNRTPKLPSSVRGLTMKDCKFVKIK